MTLHRRRWLVGGALFVALLVIIGSFALAEAPRTSPALAPISIQARPITAFDNRDPSQTRFGALEFRGGLALTSNDKAFGGISSIHVEPDGARFIAVTDNGSWLRGRIVYRDGKPAGIADAEMAPLLGPDGKPLAARGWYDAESLAELDGAFYVGIERVEQIVRFDYRRHGLLARGQPIAVPPDFKTFVKNKSLECLTAPPAGSPLAGNLIVVAERSLDDAGNHRSFSDQGRSCRALQRYAQRRLRRYRLHDLGARRPAAARAPLFARARRRHAHPPCAAWPHQAGRAGRRQTD